MLFHKSNNLSGSLCDFYMHLWKALAGIAVIHKV